MRELLLENGTIRRRLLLEGGGSYIHVPYTKKFSL